MPERPESRLVRPYAITRGRTESERVLSIETLVQRSGTPATLSLGPEERAILDLAQGPVSIAEVSARLGVMLGVARVLVGDLADEGLLTVSPGVGDTEYGDPSAPSTPLSKVELLERVLHGLQAL